MTRQEYLEQGQVICTVCGTQVLGQQTVNGRCLVCHDEALENGTR